MNKIELRMERKLERRASRIAIREGFELYKSPNGKFVLLRNSYVLTEPIRVVLENATLREVDVFLEERRVERLVRDAPEIARRIDEWTRAGYLTEAECYRQLTRIDVSRALPWPTSSTVGS